MTPSAYPWKTAKDCGDSGCQAIYDQYGKKLALVFDAPSASVFAAAPELYEALKYALRLMPPSANTSIIHDALDRAEGKSL